MKTHAAFTLIVTALIVFNTSCVHYYYAPNSNNVPLFKEKNEVRIQAASSAVSQGSYSGENINGFELQTAYAFSKQFAAQLNFFNAGSSDDTYGSGNGNYIEMAGGYFKAFDKKQWIFETYSGIGFGGVNSVFKNGGNEEEAKTSITKFFIQPSFGYCRNHFAFAIASKFSLIGIGLKSSSLTKDAYPTDYDVLASFGNGKTFFRLEPSLMIRGGFKKVQLFSEATFMVQDNSTSPFCNENFSLGIIVPFAINAKK